MAARYLINEDGKPFTDEELDALGKELDSFNPADRKSFRDANAQAIAKHQANQVLIVAGPGTGKSTLFKQRILFWLEQEKAARILALSFVRKLVADLHADIKNDTTLTADQKKQAEVFTLHKYARSIVERNHGTKDWRFAPHFRIIAQDWKAMVWGDVLSLSGQNDHESYSWPKFQKQVHDDEFDQSAEWKKLKDAYFRLCQFYNAAGFDDIILRARDALAENEGLNEHQFFIFDEYQDFNASEEKLLEQITAIAKSTLIAGDDDQVLYETLKSGKASLIRAIYGDTDVAKAMLPFCSRCDFHITRAASHFIGQGADPNCIRKIYLPLAAAEASKKVQIVGCAAPSTAVDYIRKFIEDHNDEIEKRREELATGKEKDAYLLILSPSKTVDFYKPNSARDQLFELLEPYRVERREYCDDYYKVLNYYSLAKYPTNNFTFRKVLLYEQTSQDTVTSLLKTCMAEGKSLSAVDNASIKDALAKAKKIREIVESDNTSDKKVEAIGKHVRIENPKLLRRDLEKRVINEQQADAIEHQEEEAAELDEIEVKQMSAVELMTIVGSKGLSADHVVIIGFDNVNMLWVTRNAFYVAMTRARGSLHIITALKSGGAARPYKFLDQLPDINLEFSRYAKGKRTQTVLANRKAFSDHIGYLNTQHRRQLPRT
jgi:superfamily I DNA/RNA helicase